MRRGGEERDCGEFVSQTRAIKGKKGLRCGQQIHHRERAKLHRRRERKRKGKERGDGGDVMEEERSPAPPHGSGGGERKREFGGGDRKREERRAVLWPEGEREKRMD
ncbi:predicted protein [Arabidopsis lyrata subsp. lyrata]|uniref:Predicted protein n=1 Tax=Arabidopsis lyrata subsp. lyrata TaxID=81972 RepID=D7KJD9_ARALL|nr:predicted protein [Arabidopsis lyrata subsp. lyrata]